MDKFALATTPTTLAQLIEIHDSVSRKLQCYNELKKEKVAIYD
jgi:hypothetical protein